MIIPQCSISLLHLAMRAPVLVQAFFLLFFIPFVSKAQTDTASVLKELIVQGFETRQSALLTPASIARIGLEAIDRYQLSDPLPLFNAHPGIRMEERSPGSYRLTFRGSSLRSPFGVRNVKVYWNGIPLSDANGTTYFNLVDFNALGSIEVLKGPAGSIFGAGYGGVVQMKTRPATQGQTLITGVQGGSYSTLASTMQYTYANDKLQLSTALSTRTTNGYRNHSNLGTYNAALSSSFFLNHKHTLSFAYSGAKTDYETPGGLTEVQMAANRRASRPATATLLSAQAQKAGIQQTYHLLGLTHDWNIRPSTQLSSTVFYSTNSLANPFITSYELRKENTSGYRFLLRQRAGKLLLHGGSEGIITRSTFDVAENLGGNRGADLYFTTLASQQFTHFAQAQFTLPGNLQLTGGISYNTQFYRNSTKDANGDVATVEDRPGLPWSPRIAAVKTWKNSYSLYYSLSNGYSPPTAQEMTANVETGHPVKLRAEKGLSHEVGFKAQWNPSFRSEITVFQQHISQALVRQVLENGNEYFQNTGNIKQKGIEIAQHINVNLPDRFLRRSDWLLSVALNDFRFGSYNNEGQDLHRKFLPGAPRSSVGLATQWHFGKSLLLATDINRMGGMFLNNLNTVRAAPYTTTRARATYTIHLRSMAVLQLYAGADNLLNQRYALGFDFNAFGNRFYNPAPLRNYHGGATVSLKFP